MIIKNVLVYTRAGRFERGSVRIEKDRIVQVGPESEESGNWTSEDADEASAENSLDGEGCYLIPGMIDIHTHGCIGYDFCDGTVEAVREIARYHAYTGVTTFAAATMTLPVEKLEAVLQAGMQYQQEKQQGKHPACADLAGINMEGPFISRTKRGAQKEEYIIEADAEIFHKFQQAAGGLVKYIGIAPEECRGTEFIAQVKDEVMVTLAHSNANYAAARKAFEAGAGHVTHLYNAMRSFNHREPGIVGAVADCRHVEAELIGDGIHVHPAVIRSTFALLGAERIILISDSIRAAGMPDGEYELGGQQVTVNGGKAVLTEDGAIAGSVTSLPDCLRYVVQEAGIPLEEAVACVTVNPAKSLGIFEEYGSISVGKKADLVLLDKDLRVRTVLKTGQVL